MGRAALLGLGSGNHWLKVMAFRGSRFWTLIGVAAIAVIGAVVIFYVSLTESLSAQLRFGADQVNSEPYEVADGIAHVVTRTYPGLDVRLVPTGGSSDNIKLLAEGKLDLALVQADAVSRENVSLIAILYPDLYQLLVRPDSGIASVHDLENKRIAVPPLNTAENRAFWLLANHYGLAPEKLDAMPMTEKAAATAVTGGKVDAIFGMRGPRNEQFRFLINSAGLVLVPIDQGAAIHLRQPAFRVASLPKGAYRGTPPMPQEDMPTVAVDRLLLARADLSDKVVHAITAVLFENRRELLLRTPLATFIRQPEMEAGTLLPVHAGSIEYFDREKPGFFEQKADFFALLLSLGVVLGTIGIAVSRRLEERKKGRVEVYTLELLELEKSAKAAQTIPELNLCKSRLTEILTRVVHDMTQKRISSEGLQLFSFIWESVNYTVNDHEEQLRLGSSLGPVEVRAHPRRRAGAH